jgi:DNA-binding protein
MAKSCFEKGIIKGDISGFCHTALAFCLIQMNEDKEVKTKSRRELKKAIHSLESMKRNFMSNLQMAEYLPQLTTDEI